MSSLHTAASVHTQNPVVLEGAGANQTCRILTVKSRMIYASARSLITSGNLNILVVSFIVLRSSPSNLIFVDRVLDVNTHPSDDIGVKPFPFIQPSLRREKPKLVAREANHHDFLKLILARGS